MWPFRKKPKMFLVAQRDPEEVACGHKEIYELYIDLPETIQVGDGIIISTGPEDRDIVVLRVVYKSWHPKDREWQIGITRRENGRGRPLYMTELSKLGFTYIPRD